MNPSSDCWVWVLARGLLSTGKLKQTNKPIKNKRRNREKKIQFCCPGVPLQEPFVPVKDEAVLCSQLLSGLLCTSWVISANQGDPCVKRFAPTYSTPRLGTGTLARIRARLELRQKTESAGLELSKNPGPHCGQRCAPGSRTSQASLMVSLIIAQAKAISGDGQVTVGVY